MTRKARTGCLERRRRYMFAIGQDDHAKEPGATATLREAAVTAGPPAEIEVYPADHVWTVIDSPSYEAAAAERGWERMSALFATL